MIFDKTCKKCEFVYEIRLKQPHVDPQIKTVTHGKSGWWCSYTEKGTILDNYEPCTLFRRRRM